MKYLNVIGLLVLLCAAGVLPTLAQSVDSSIYAWQFPVATGVSGANDLIDDLRGEVQKILDLGHLAPLTLRYGDLVYESYWVYQEPGRIITTLAWAYPYLTPVQKAAVQQYVANELSTNGWSPWSNYPASRTEGARRELHPLTEIWGRGSPMGAYRPHLHTLYGLWLYAFRSGDWAALQPYLTDMESHYNDWSDEARTYGTTCADIGMVRLAEHFGHAAMRNVALANLQQHLTQGLDFAAVESYLQNGTQGWNAPYGPQYNSRNDNLIYQGWMFLNMSPEIGRYLRDYHLTTVAARNQWARTRFPLWWLSAAQYFCRWAGDESIGIPSEMFGMIVPVERWVLNLGSASLSPYFRSAPTCIGDCYWIEGLVTAIEAHGTTIWADVRGPLPVADLTISYTGSDVVLNWTPTGAASYNVYAGNSADSMSSLVGTISAPPLILSGEVEQYGKRLYRVTAVQ